MSEAERGTEMSNATDAERREAARELRCTDVSDLTPERMDNGDGRTRLAERIAEALCVQHAPYYFDAEPVIKSLADLIEPSCDRDALLEVADTLRTMVGDEIDGDELVLNRAGCLILANRIRKACGEGL